ncbi:hypothetical protein ACTQ5K_14230 [Niallia sp. Sow4_A1]|uniref:Uncharacterized protein n=1 Tax=Niallia hominis TaxID=3133173 RepID=A0ABV1F4E9_9BACI|nr:MULTISPECIES: hypothetical protein [Bacillaceae]MCM3362770.1 hypothetical protein [Niallia sp. MER TA 168]CAI9396555.1 hypothetical protein BACSP_01271 [Bacillus sp. T2.9-1]
MEKKYGEHTINQKLDAVEVYKDPRMVLRIKKSKEEASGVTIELHNTLNGRLSYDLPVDLLKKIISEIE